MDSVESIQKNAITDGFFIVKYVRLIDGFRFAQMGVYKMAPNHEFMIAPHERDSVLSAGTFELDYVENDGRFYVALNPHKSYTLKVGPREEDRVLIEEIFNAS